MGAQRRQWTRRARLARLRPAGAVAGQGVGIALACTLWLGVASPSLQVLPGIDGLADESIEISLQSALLGIDDRSGRPTADEALAAADVLGLSYAEQLAARADAGAQGPVAGSNVVRLSETLAQLAAPQPPPDAPAPVAVQIAHAPTPAAPAPRAPATPPAAPAAASPAAPVEEPTGEPPPLLRAQTVSFASFPPDAVVGGSYHVVATATSGLPVRLSATADHGACRLSGATVTFLATGRCVIDAHQAGNSRFASADARQWFEIGRAGQTIAFTSKPPTRAVVGGTYGVAATASSRLPVSFSIGTGSGGVCKLAGTTVTFTAVGTCTIAADQAGDESHLRARRALQSFPVIDEERVRVAQTISFTSTPPSPGIVNGATYSVAASATSGLPVTFAAATSSAGVCTVAGSVVWFVGEGTCTVDAHQDGDAGHLPAPVVQQSFAVERAAQALSFVTSPPSPAVAGETAYAIGAVATSGLPVILSVADASTSVCAVSGSTVTALSAGTCTVQANQLGDGAYRPATPVQQSFAVASAPPSLSDQTITFTSPPPSPATAGTTYAVAASASSGLGVVFSIGAGSAGVCTVSGSTVSLLAAGTCTIAADQAGGSGYRPAPQVLQSFAVVRASQAIGFGSTPPYPADVGGPDYVVSATASSGLSVVFAAAPASAGICTVSGSSVALVGAGTCTIVASQAGDSAFAAAPDVEQSFTIGGGAPTQSPQSISFTSTPPANATAGGGAYTVAAVASSGLPVVFSAAPGSAGVCSVSGSTVSFAGAGTCTIDADQAGSVSYQPAPRAQQSFSVAAPDPSAQTITFTSTPPGSAAYGGASYSVAATASSGLPVSFSIAPASADVCSLSGSTVSFVGAGTCAIRANQSGNAAYAPAPQVQQSFTVARAAQTITITSTPPGEVDRHSPPYTIAATASSGLAVTFSIAPGSNDNCVISGSTITFRHHGNCVVHANQGGNADHLPAPRAQQTIVVVPNA